MKTGPKAFGVLIFVVALWAQNSALAGVFYDDGIYLTLAKSLAEGHGYHYAHLPGTPAGIHYPPLYPALLSFIWFVWPLFPANLIVIKLFNAACFGAAAMILAHYSERIQLSTAARYAALLVGFTVFPLLSVIGVIMSEPLFLVLAGWAVIVLERDDGRRWQWIAGGVLLGAVILTRNIGVALLAGALPVVWIKHGKERAVVTGAAALVMLIPWVWWLIAQSGTLDPRIAANYGTYLTEAAEAGPGGFLAGLDLRAVVPLTRLSLPRLPAILAWPLSLALLGVTAWGGYRSLKHVPVLVASLAVYMVVVTLWPYTPDRFVWIAVPWLVLFLARGLGDIWTKGRWGKSAALLLCLFLVAGWGGRELRSLEERGFESAARGISSRFALGLASMATETDPNSVIATEDEALVYLYTGRKTVPNYLFHWQGRETQPLPQAETLRFFCDNGVSHIFTTGPDTEASRTIAYLRQEGIAVPLFEITSGPALFQLRCR